MGATSRMLTAFAALSGLVLAAALAACAGDEEALPAASPATATPSNSTPTLAPSPADASPIPTSQDEDDIRETVFRYLFDHNASALQRDATVYFLSLGEFSEDVDPPSAFMLRFADNSPPVKPVSLAQLTPASGSGESVTDKETGRKGLIFRVFRVSWLSADSAEVEGGYYEAGLSSAIGIYSVERQGGSWVVVNERTKAIS